MTRTARSSLAAILLSAAAGVVFVGGAAVVVPVKTALGEGTVAIDIIVLPATELPDGAMSTAIAPHPSSTTTVAPTTTQPIDQAIANATAIRSRPDRATRIRIETIDVNAKVVDLGLNPDRTLEVPADVRLSGWWTGRSVPGEPGPGIVVGHVDSARQGPGVFFRLRELDVGDAIHVERSDGSTAEFRVTETELVLKSEFPTEKVYGSVQGSQLRLITCGGSFDSSARSYAGNLIVFAEHVGTVHPPTRESLQPLL
jgi:sortase (surface protein transpeptidase)